MKNVKIRIGNLKFGQACYLGGKPKYPSYHIDVIEPNSYYYEFQKGYFEPIPDIPDHFRYVGPNEDRRNLNSTYEKSCFEGKENSWAIAQFNYNPEDGSYDFDFFRWNEFLDKKLESYREDFWKLLKAIDDSGIFEYDNIEPDEV